MDLCCSGGFNSRVADRVFSICGVGVDVIREVPPLDGPPDFDPFFRAEEFAARVMQLLDYDPFSVFSSGRYREAGWQNKARSPGLK